MIFVLLGSFLIFNLSSVLAADIEDAIGDNFEIDPDTGLPREVDGIKNLSDSDTRNEYLKKEWGKILNNSRAGPYIDKTQYYGQKMNPVWKTLLGIEFTLSWIFILTFILYIILLDFGFDILTAIEARFDFFGEQWIKLVKWGFFIVYFLIISFIQAAHFLSRFIIYWISDDLHWAIQLLLLAIIIFAIIFVNKLGSSIKKFFVKNKKERDIKSNKKELKEQKDDTQESLSYDEARISNLESIEKERKENDEINLEAKKDLFGSGSD